MSPPGNATISAADRTRGESSNEKRIKKPCLVIAASILARRSPKTSVSTPGHGRAAFIDPAAHGSHCAECRRPANTYYAASARYQRDRRDDRSAGRGGSALNRGERRRYLRRAGQSTRPAKSGVPEAARPAGPSDRVQLIFDRVVTKKTPGEFRTRVIQDGVHPSLHISYKNFDLKQYFKEGRGCRTEGTFRNPKDL